MIRKGTPEDFEKIIPLCKKFWESTEFEEPYEPEQSLVYLQMAYDNDLLAVVEIDKYIVGFTAGIKSPLMGNSKVYSGIELAWWINPEYRNKLLGSDLFDFMETLAKEAGVKYWCMVSLQTSSPDKVNTFYEKKGYHLSEQTYVRNLWQQ